MSFHLSRFTLPLPLVAITLGVAIPAEAASFAGASVKAALFDFNLPALNTNTFAQSDSFSDAGNAGFVFNTSDASALFFQDPADISNITFGTSDGDGTHYVGSTQGSTEVFGTFRVEDLFSFNFETVLDLAYAIDRPGRESAKAAGGVQFSLFSSPDANNLGSLVDQFSLAGLVSTGGPDVLDSFSSGSFALAAEDCSSLAKSCRVQTGDDFASVAFSVLKGTYNRSFLAPTYLTLVETKYSSTHVQVPEPGAIIAVLFAGSIMVRRRSSFRASL